MNNPLSGSRAIMRIIFLCTVLACPLVAAELTKPPDHWAFKPPVRPAEPAVKNQGWPRNAVDRFILARLEQLPAAAPRNNADDQALEERRAQARRRATEMALQPSAEADRATLIRRLSFDLIGLPPTPEAVVEFIADTSPDAYEKLVERLLASAHYGECWGRHWLDAAGYADSNGYFDADSDRPLAWKYRDYVIKSFNEDKPFDRFIREQLAGDELAGYQPDGDITPEMEEPLVATHFLRNAPDGTGESDGNAQELRADRYAVLEGNVQIIGSAFLGLTVQCARCHNHKFEPITQEEYYQLQAILTPVYNHEHWLKPNERVVAVGRRVQREENKRKSEKFEREFKTLKESLGGLTAPFRKLAQEENLEKLPDVLRADLKKALETKEKDRTEAMKALLATNETSIEIKDEDLLKRFPEFAIGYKSLKEAIKEKETEKPTPLPQIAAATGVTPAPPPHHLLVRGNYGNPGREAEPGVPAVLCNPRNVYQIDSGASVQNNSTRRLAFARWLTSPEHPTFARLIVNRIWQHHFGVGLVATSDNFGVTGAKPSHPELLDYLATELVRSGWSVKAMHRLIVNSATYRQSSALREECLEIDPENRLLWRYSLQRLDAESVRDAMLFITGELDGTLGGPYVPSKRTSEGQVIVEEANPGAKRRSLYLQQRRTQPLALLDVFDAPQQQPNCTRRNPSTVSLQSLALLNSDFVRVRSRAFAQRLDREAGTDQARRLDRAFQLTLGRPPRTAESNASREFLETQSAYYANKPNASELVWADFCQILFANNGYLYVE